MIPFSPDAFWLKAKLFTNRATDPDDGRTEDERRFWASLSLELLAKWSLAKTSRVLVVDPGHGGGEQLYKALGLRDSVDHVTVTATTAFKRCDALYKSFDLKTAKKISDARNEYVHGFEVPIMHLPDSAWWSQYWSLVSVLLAAHSLEPSALVGNAQARQVEEHLEENSRWLEQRVEALIEASELNLRRFESDSMPPTEAERWKYRDDFTAGMRYSSVATCPACGNLGTVEGEAVNNVSSGPSRDFFGDQIYEVAFSGEFFACTTCHLILDSWDLMRAAGLDEEYYVEVEPDLYTEPEYGND